MNWIKKSDHPDYKYTLEEDGKLILEMDYDLRVGANKAFCHTEESDFDISREGFWQAIPFLHENGASIGRLEPESWSGDESLLMLKGEKLHVRFWNNPTAEIRITQDDHLMVSIGLKSDHGNSVVTVHEAAYLKESPCRPYVHALAWYLFLPVAVENTVEYAVA